MVGELQCVEVSRTLIADNSKKEENKKNVLNYSQFRFRYATQLCWHVSYELRVDVCSARAFRSTVYDYCGLSDDSVAVQTSCRQRKRTAGVSAKNWTKCGCRWTQAVSGAAGRASDELRCAAVCADELLAEKEKYKGISEELDETFTELAEY